MVKAFVGRAASIGALGGEVSEDPPDHRGLGDQCDDPHHGPAPRAHEGICLVDAVDEPGQTAARRKSRWYWVGYLVSLRYVILWGRVAASPRVCLRQASYSEKLPSKKVTLDGLRVD